MNTTTELKKLAAYCNVEIVKLPPEAPEERELRLKVMTAEEAASWEHPQLELLAPDHFQFACGLHAMVCTDATDALERLKVEGYPLVECPADCDCSAEPE